MCTQSVGLAAAVFEEHGISTACIALVRSVAERLRPPRALAVPFDFGVPLGAAGDAAQQRRVLRALLALLEEPGPGPILLDYVWTPTTLEIHAGLERFWHTTALDIFGEQ